MSHLPKLAKCDVFLIFLVIHYLLLAIIPEIQNVKQHVSGYDSNLNMVKQRQEIGLMLWGCVFLEWVDKKLLYI